MLYNYETYLVCYDEQHDILLYKLIPYPFQPLNGENAELLECVIKKEKQINEF